MYASSVGYAAAQYAHRVVRCTAAGSAGPTVIGGHCPHCSLACGTTRHRRAGPGGCGGTLVANRAHAQGLLAHCCHTAVGMPPHAAAVFGAYPAPTTSTSIAATTSIAAAGSPWIGSVVPGNAGPTMTVATAGTPSGSAVVTRQTSARSAGAVRSRHRLLLPRGSTDTPPLDVSSGVVAGARRQSAGAWRGPPMHPAPHAMTPDPIILPKMAAAETCCLFEQHVCERAHRAHRRAPHATHTFAATKFVAN